MFLILCTILLVVRMRLAERGFVIWYSGELSYVAFSLLTIFVFLFPRGCRFISVVPTSNILVSSLVLYPRFVRQKGKQYGCET